MTHDELLADLQDVEPIYARATLYSALRAVVELHKPKDMKTYDEFITCELCGVDDFRDFPYPCPTIQAIEKELE
jgi:Fe2+ or Zn2+ uptake regulation protein